MKLYIKLYLLTVITTFIIFARVPQLSAGISHIILNDSSNATIYLTNDGNRSLLPSGEIVYPEWWGEIDGVADEVQINEAISSLMSGTVFLSSKEYTISSSIIGKSDVNLIGSNAIINIDTPGIKSFSATSQDNIIISGIIFNGSGENATTERLIFLESCANIDIRDCTFTNSIIGVQVQSTTGTKVNGNTFINIIRKSDYSEGYGVLANLDSKNIQVSNNSFSSIGRHAVYFSSGSSNCIASNNTVYDMTGAPFVAHSYTAQNTMRNITFTDNIIHGIQLAGGGSDDVYGFIATGNIDGIIISNNQIYDNDAGGGIFVQNSATDINTLKNAVISGNIINTIDNGAGVYILNGSNISITNNQIKEIDVSGGVWSGIVAVASGTGTGSFVDNVIIENNIVDTGKYSISIAGANIDHRATNIIIGDNQLTNATSSTFNMSDAAYVGYKTKWESFNPQFYIDNALSSQTDTEATAGSNSGYNAFIAPFSGWVYSIYGKVNGAITNESILLELKINGVPKNIGVTISAGDLYEKNILKLGTGGQSISEGDTIQMIYTTPAGYLPTTLEVSGGIKIIRDISQ